MKSSPGLFVPAFTITVWRFLACVLLASSPLLTLFGAIGELGAKGALILHEWGTFTSLQNNQGEAIGGINSDDEPVPHFVHHLGDFLLLGTEVPPNFSQGAPHCHPDVTMRLETPVIYFHPPGGKPLAQKFDLSATFKGGWLSEYYPNAETDTNCNVFGPLRSTTVSTLFWKDLQLAGEWSGPETSDHVWTAPRQVKAASVRTGSGESEKFLFYRGVARINAPLTACTDAKTREVVLRSGLAPELAGNPNLKMKSLWLVHIRDDGQVAFRDIPSLTLCSEDKTLARASMDFGFWDYSNRNRDALKSSLQAALTGEGLFQDEARALLNTWELSYFKSSGWRIFFLVPRAWTDFYLPLQVSTLCEITRVMVGRIELVTEKQKEALRQLASFSEGRIKADAQELRESFYSKPALSSPQQRAVFEGRKPLDALPVRIPKSYALYLGLGRFRDALLLDEQKNHPSKSLEAFIYSYGLLAHNPARNRLPTILPTRGGNGATNSAN
jgi:hypothetical protein